MAAGRRRRKVEGVPVLKLPPKYLGGVIRALRANEYDRDGFREAVLELFADDKSEKSVFRGMAVPTLRSLGLMLGFEAEMRLSSDGSLVGLGLDKSPADLGPLALVLAEIERSRGLDSYWSRRSRAADVVLTMIEGEMAGGGASADTQGRVRRWLSYLEFSGLVVMDSAGRTSRKPVERPGLARKAFEQELTRCYRLLSPRTVGEPVVEIDQVRRCVAENLYRDSVALTSAAFDDELKTLLSSKAAA